MKRVTSNFISNLSPIPSSGAKGQFAGYVATKAFTAMHLTNFQIFIILLLIA